ncbi:MAG: winged helix-turn-helix transcriptional regulator [Atopobiaceae bacterium]|jgi:DNA-binding HxlR family transcriptional regulator
MTSKKNQEILEKLPLCPVQTTLTLISDKWQILIIRDLLNSTMRFGELQRSVGGISQKVLTTQLRKMEAAGLVHREVYAEVPPHVEYSLTELGRTLKPIVDAMWQWGEMYKERLAQG